MTGREKNIFRGLGSCLTAFLCMRCLFWEWFSVLLFFPMKWIKEGVIALSFDWIEGCNSRGPYHIVLLSCWAIKWWMCFWLAEGKCWVWLCYWCSVFLRFRCFMLSDLHACNIHIPKIKRLFVLDYQKARGWSYAVQLRGTSKNLPRAINRFSMHMSSSAAFAFVSDSSAFFHW